MSDKVQISWADLKYGEGFRRQWFQKGDEGVEMHVVAEGITAEGTVVEVQIPVEHFLNSLGIELVNPECFTTDMAPPGTTLAHARKASSGETEKV
jgi:hypothetical protein